MKNTKINIRCFENNKRKDVEVDRNDMYAVFNGLLEGFSHDNSVSSQLLPLIPTADVIVVNRDINMTQDVPFIVVLATSEDGTEEVKKMIKIMRRHTIVWSIINKYCDG